MARGATISVENNFTQGLITEFTALNFPENAVTEGDNVVFSELGRATRRKGLDYETGYQIRTMSSLSPDEGAFVEFKWDSVGGTGTISFIVQQIGSRVRFFRVGEASISTELKSFSVNLLTYKTSVADTLVYNNPCQFTFGKGYLFIVHPFVESLAVEYDEDTDTISVTQIDVEVRDFERLEDGLEIDERPTTLSGAHKYNLYNQGWYVDAIIAGNSNPRPVLETWNVTRDENDWPSNSDIWWIYKNASETAYFRSSFDTGNVSPSQVTLGNTPAPSGHYIYNAWNVNRQSETGISGILNQSSGTARPSCVAFYAGRIFYAGVSANKYSDKVYFSQIIESDDQFGKCYQANDPTSETTFDLLDTDGGVLSIPLISKVVSLQVLNDALIVVGTNGVFAIRGTESGPFKATDYTVEYVSSVGGVSALSIVNVDNSLIWWNYDAMYALTKGQTGIFYEVQNASKSTIQSVIDLVPPINREYIKGVYNKKARIVQWLYNDQPDSKPFTYNRILEFNVVSRAFYTHTISTDKAPRIVGLISVSGQAQQVFESNVTDNSLVTVTSNDSENVIIEEALFIPNIEVFKYATSGLISGGSSGFTYSQSADDPIDWGELGGSSFVSYFESGYRIRGEILRQFNVTPIAVVVDNIEDGEVIFKGRWDYGSRESMPQWLYVTARTSDTLHNRHRGEYIIRRIKPRGKGRSFQLRFESDGDHPFSIVGWSSFDTGGQLP